MARGPQRLAPLRVARGDLRSEDYCSTTGREARHSSRQSSRQVSVPTHGGAHTSGDNFCSICKHLERVSFLSNKALLTNDSVPFVPTAQHSETTWACSPDIFDTSTNVSAKKPSPYDGWLIDVVQGILACPSKTMEHF